MPFHGHLHGEFDVSILNTLLHARRCHAKVDSAGHECERTEYQPCKEPFAGETLSKNWTIYMFRLKDQPLTLINSSSRSDVAMQMYRNKIANEIEQGTRRCLIFLAKKWSSPNHFSDYKYSHAWKFNYLIWIRGYLKHRKRSAYTLN